MPLAVNEEVFEKKGPGRLIPLVMQPPKSRTVTLVWSGSGGLTEGSANAGAFNFYRLNSVYDVDTSVGSTSTPGFAEWAAFYSNYRVSRTRVRVEGTVSGLSSGAYATVCLVPNPLQATLPASSIEWPVQFGALHKTVVNNTSGGTNTFTLDKQYYMPEVFKVTKSQFRNEFDYTASTGANPARQAYVALTVRGIGSNVAAAYAQVYVGMEIEFFNPILLAT
jgi:hypothetical protein